MRILMGLVVAVLLSGWGTALAPLDGAGEPVAAAAVGALVSGDAGRAQAAVPAGFAETAGYRPVIVDGVLVRPDGGCSSPLGATGYDFTLACARHDLGYDLLRHAARSGRPLPQWARRALDDQFVAGLSARCAAVRGGPGCAAAAALYAGVVRVNAQRQGHGPPLTESGARAAGALLAGAVAAWLAGSIRRRTAGVVGACVAVGSTALVEPVLPLAPGAGVLVTAIVAGHGYLAGALAARLACRIAGRAAAGRTAPHRVAPVGLAVALLVTSCSPARAAAPPPHPGGAGVAVYVELAAAPTAVERARLAVQRLERSGGLTRSTVLAVVPTGSGWVNPDAVAAAGDDLVAVAVQYAARPSWQEYLLGTDAVREQAVALVSALRARLDRIEPGRRPRLLVYGESLGAIGARASASGADAVLLAGVPAGRWAPQDGDPRVRAVEHRDDPVVWFSPRLLVARPPGWPGRWLPVVSFWQTAGALLGALDAPAGHGHRYGPELADAWRSTGT